MVRGEQLDIEAALARVADAIDCLLRAGVDRMRRVLAGGQLIGEFGREAGPCQDPDERQRGSGRYGAAPRETGVGCDIVSLPLLAGASAACHRGPGPPFIAE